MRNLLEVTATICHNSFMLIDVVPIVEDDLGKRSLWTSPRFSKAVINNRCKSHNHDRRALFIYGPFLYLAAAPTGGALVGALEVVLRTHGYILNSGVILCLRPLQSLLAAHFLFSLVVRGGIKEHISTMRFLDALAGCRRNSYLRCLSVRLRLIGPSWLKPAHRPGTVCAHQSCHF
jgi:hypothetical protein